MLWQRHSRGRHSPGVLLACPESLLSGLAKARYDYFLEVHIVRDIVLTLPHTEFRLLAGRLCGERCIMLHDGQVYLRQWDAEAVVA